MHVLVTRPVEDAEPFKSRLEEFGCRVTLAPLIETVPNAIREEILEGATALIATSRNALAALSASPALPSAVKLPIYVVGPGTAAIARNIGFKQVIEGAGAAADLASILVSDGLAPDNRLIYLRGDVVAFDLEGVLANAGINVTPITAYQSVAAETLPPNVIKALQTGSIDAVTLMSPRTAETWMRLVARLSPPVQLCGVSYLCLSERVAEALGPPGKGDKVAVASLPNLEEMLALVKRLAANSKAE
jgi:uroporphyrinogen-III synthase